ncbi:hypothetical protein B0H15DRAFT_750453, partial [Mycena belliarum]
NTSGSGKTRLTFEGLSQSWGLYFTSCVDVQGHGSIDLQTSIKEIENHKHFTRDLPSADYDFSHKRNCQIASDRLGKVLYARLVILLKFCKLA